MHFGKFDHALSVNFSWFTSGNTKGPFCPQLLKLSKIKPEIIIARTSLLNHDMVFPVFVILTLLYTQSFSKGDSELSFVTKLKGIKSSLIKNHLFILK